MDESMLEEFLIRPLLKQVLGHHFVPQAKVELGAKRPDYAFFENDIHWKEALGKKGIDDFYLKARAVRMHTEINSNVPNFPSLKI